MNKLYTITFECEVLTPMFIGNADSKQAELRPPSIKGAMRFWWRAMNGGKDTKSLALAEKKLFGGTADPDNDKNTGKSKVLLSIKNDNVDVSNNPFRAYPNLISTQLDPSGRPRRLDSILFMGYGKGLPPSKKENRPSVEWANYIQHGSLFKVILASFNLEDLKVAAQSFIILEQFGGVGGKSRNGFGSFMIKKVEDGSGILDNFDPNSVIKGEFFPSYPAFSSHSVLIESALVFNSWHESMDDLARSYYSAKQKLTKRDNIPDSGMFINKKEFAGMLLNQTKIRLREKPNRIPKPFYMKIFRSPDGKYGWRILYLPTKFLEGIKNNSNSYIMDKLQKEFLAYMELMVAELKAKGKEEQK